MATFELNTDRSAWVPRRPLTVTGVAAYTCYVEDSAGTVTLGGKVLRSVSYDVWKKISPTPDLYVMKTEAAPVRSFAQRLCEATLEETSSFVHIWVYCPDIRKFPNEPAETRLQRLGQALRKASQIKADIFVGPEYFFTKSSRSLESGISVDQTYSQQEKERVSSALGEVARANRGMLIIPGTMLWKDSAGAVRNTAFINCRLNGVAHEHSKSKPHHDATYASDASGTWTSGSTHFDFEYRGWSVRFQICADNSNDADGAAPKDLHILSGFGFGAYNARAHRGGWEVVSDGTGWGRIEQVSAPVQLATRPDSENFGLVVHIHKMRTF